MQSRSMKWLARLAVPAVIGAGIAASAGPALADSGSDDDKVKIKLDDGRLKVKGTDDADRIALRLRAADPTILEVDVHDDGKAEFAVKLNRLHRILVEAKGGEDRVRIDETAVPFNVSIPIVLDGGAAADSLLGGASVEHFFGRGGKDFVDGNRGNDRGIMGSGDDVFQWDPGDGNDTIEGEAGRDEMLFNGANAPENIDITANGQRVRFFRDVASVLMDLNDVEGIRFNALGGIDRISVGDLTGTDMKNVTNDLAGTLGGTTGDAAADRVIVTGTHGEDRVTVAGDGANTTVSGLSAVVNLLNAEATDSLVVSTLGGNDAVDATGLLAGAPQLTADLGAGNDKMLGSVSKDIVLAGDGEDFADPNRGDDLGQMGAGDDVFQWDPGDGNDTIEGQAGTRDKMLFNGANVAENIDISANSSRVRFFRDVANVLMDLNEVEAIRFNALGGPDKIVVGDLSGTHMKLVDNALAGVLNGTAGDGQIDEVVANGTHAADKMAVKGAHGSVELSGLPALIAISGAESHDKLTVNGNAGDDKLDATGLAPGTINLKFNQ